MFRSYSLSARIGAIAAAIVWSATSMVIVLTPTLAQAQASASSYYTAQLVEPAPERQAVAGGLVWSCSETRCVANKGNSRPLRVCRELNRKFGEVAEFVTRGSVMPSDELARCNA